MKDATAVLFKKRIKIIYLTSCFLCFPLTQATNPKLNILNCEASSTLHAVLEIENRKSGFLSAIMRLLS